MSKKRIISMALCLSMLFLNIIGLTGAVSAATEEVFKDITAERVISGAKLDVTKLFTDEGWKAQTPGLGWDVRGYIQIDLKAPKIITEISWSKDVWGAKPTLEVQASNDEDFSNAVSIGAFEKNTNTMTSTNTTDSFRYVRIVKNAIDDWFPVKIQVNGIELSHNTKLSSLSVSGHDIKPDFDSAVYSYQLEFDGLKPETVTVGAAAEDPDATITYNGGTSATVNLEECAGKIDVEVTAADKVTKNVYTILVLDSDVSQELIGIRIDTLPDKVVYGIGEALDLTGLVVKGQYYAEGLGEFEKTENITSENITGFSSDIAVKDKKITVTVGDKSASFDIIVEGKLSSGDENRTPTAKRVIGTDVKDVSGILTDTGIGDGAKITWSERGYIQIDLKETFAITRVAWDKGVWGSKVAVKIYASNDEDFTKSVQIGSIADGSSECKNIDSDKGFRYIRVSKEVDGDWYPVKLAVYGAPWVEIAKECTEVKIESLPTKLTYVVGEALDLTGLVVKAKYYIEGTGEVEEIAEITEENISGFNTETAAKNRQLTITVGGQSAYFNIIVEKRLTLAEENRTPTAKKVIGSTQTDVSDVLLSSGIGNTNANIGWTSRGYIQIDLKEAFAISRVAWTRYQGMGQFPEIKVYASNDEDFENSVKIGTISSDAATCNIENNQAFRYVRLAKEGDGDFYPNVISLYGMDGVMLNRVSDTQATVRVPSDFFEPGKSVVLFAAYEGEKLVQCNFDTPISTAPYAEVTLDSITADSTFKLFTWDGFEFISPQDSEINLK